MSVWRLQREFLYSWIGSLTQIQKHIFSQRTKRTTADLRPLIDISPRDASISAAHILGWIILGWIYSPLFSKTCQTLSKQRHFQVNYLLRLQFLKYLFAVELSNLTIRGSLSQLITQDSGAQNQLIVI